MVKFTVKLLLVVEKDAILVVYYRLSKMIHFVAITEMSAEGLARLFKNNIWKLYRLSKRQNCQSHSISRQIVKWFALEGESPQSWLGHAQSVEAPAMSLVIQTCQNNLGLNLCVVPPTSCMVTISENSLVRSCKEKSKVRCHWYQRFSIKFSQLSG